MIFVSLPRVQVEALFSAIVKILITMKRIFHRHIRVHNQ